jgi:hypothetical protein
MNDPATGGNHRKLLTVVALAIAAVAVSLFVLWNGSGRGYEINRKLSFDGSSDELRHTTVVATLDTPIPDGQSAVWCSSFQLAWNRLKVDIAKGPVRIRNAEAAATRLNQAEQSESDLDTHDFYATAGFVSDEVVGRIQAEMRQKFPKVPPPHIEAAAGAVAYGYVNVHAKFAVPFFENEEPLAFAEPNNLAVKSFGIRQKDSNAYRTMREQVDVLYRSEEKQRPEFIVDPCKYSEPYQIMFAAIARRPTLAEAVADVDEKVATVSSSKSSHAVGYRDTLLIPSMNWRISHHFKELEGEDKEFENPSMKGLYLDKALETIQFRLDRSGAELESESQIGVKSAGESHFHFDRPFLIILRKRNAKQPFFVMWVANSELLEK